MDAQLLELFKVLGTASIAFIIWLIIKEIGVILKSKNSNHLEERLTSLEKLFANDTRHELDNIWTELRDLQNDIDKLNERFNEEIIFIEKKLVVLETKKYGKK